MSDNNTPIRYLSVKGLEEAKAELLHLETVERNEITAEMAVALEFGNLAENADYESARNRQAFVEGRIAELRVLIADAVIIKAPSSDKQVALGSRVDLSGPDGPASYVLVGSAEADPGSGRISNESPLGKALLGRKPGDTVVVHAPAGDFSYKVEKISRG